MRETEWWLKDSVPTLSSQLKPVDDSDDRSLGTAAIGMYADGADGDGLTAFRRAEKRYKLHREQIVRTQANGRRKGGKLVTRPVNLADVLDTVDFARLATLGPASRVSTLASTSGDAPRLDCAGAPAAMRDRGDPGLPIGRCSANVARRAPAAGAGAGGAAGSSTSKACPARSPRGTSTSNV